MRLAHLRLAGEIADTALVGARHLTPEIVKIDRGLVMELGTGPRYTSRRNASRGQNVSRGRNITRERERRRSRRPGGEVRPYLPNCGDQSSVPTSRVPAPDGGGR